MFGACADALWRGGKTSSARLYVAFSESATYSPAWPQGSKVGQFVLTNVTTCKLFLAQKSSLRDLIFGLVSPARAHTRAGECAPPSLSFLPPPSLARLISPSQSQPALALAGLA